MRAGVLVLLGGCGGPAPVELIDGAAWSPLPDDHPLATGPCTALAWVIEGEALELRTDGCSPVAVTTTLAGPVRAGDALEVLWWHDYLVADEPAEGRFALYVDGAEIYGATEPIPSGWATRTEAFEAPSGGTELVVRVENHGANTWNLLRLTRLRRGHRERPSDGRVGRPQFARPREPRPRRTGTGRRSRVRGRGWERDARCGWQQRAWWAGSLSRAAARASRRRRT